MQPSEANLIRVLGKIEDQDRDFQLYADIVGRIVTTASFVGKRLPRAKSRHYQRYMFHLHERLGDFYFFSPSENLTATSFIVATAEAMAITGLESVGFWDTITGEVGAEVEARALATRHVLDLILSFRRFEGHKPGSNLDVSQRRLADAIRVSDLESLIKN